MIDKIKEKLITANEQYRIGDPIMSDKEFDELIEEFSLLSPDDDLLSKIGYNISDNSRKIKLPIDMASMNKIKSMDDINNWCRLKFIPLSTQVVITPKYDGLSLCVNEKNSSAFTRGDGVFGQKSNEHYKFINNKLTNSVFEYTYGEVIMPKQVFNDKYSKDFANPRNLVAGLINSKEINISLKDCQYIKYGGITNNKFKTKNEILDELNKNQNIKVPYKIFKISDLTEDILLNLFKEYCLEYEIDGLIIEINNLDIQKSLGRETSTNNPCFARAFKHPSFEEKLETEVIGITWNVSKQGMLKPIINIKPIKLDGVTVSNVTGNNAKFIKEMGIGIGSIVSVKRSGMVIPIIVNVLKKVDFKMPEIDGIEIDWNDNGIELITLTETDEQKIKKNIAFFEILETDNISDGVIRQLWNAGYKTIKDILNLTKDNLEIIDGFGKRKSKIVYDSIKKCTKNVPLSKLQHASGFFSGLGQLKLVKLEHFTEKPSMEDIIRIDGFAEISAIVYISNYDNFFNFIKDLPITISENLDTINIGNDLENKQFVFTGIRLPEIEEIIKSRGGKIGSAVSKNTTYLIMKTKGTGTSKENKAIELGVSILNVEELNAILNNNS